MATTVCRFVVVSTDGRRSSEWRVWTGQEGKKPTDDVYLAPRTQIVDFKISLHKDGWGQYGLSQAVRDALRPGDRHAPLRWELSRTEMFPGWLPMYTIVFPESELDTVAPSDEAPIVIPAPSSGNAIGVMILASAGADVELPSGLDEGVVALLDRKNGGKVAVVAVPMPFDDGVLASLEVPPSGMSPWAISGSQAESEPFGWMVNAASDGTRMSTEFNGLRRRTDREFVIPGFTGVIRPWDERPRVDRDISCAVLVCPGGGPAQLYLDLRARCNHAHLASDVNDLVLAHGRGELDHGWGRLPNGDAYTCLAMPRVLEELGGIDPSQWAPGPGKG